MTKRPIESVIDDLRVWSDEDYSPKYVRNLMHEAAEVLSALRLAGEELLACEGMHKSIPVDFVIGQTGFIDDKHPLLQEYNRRLPIA